MNLIRDAVQPWPYDPGSLRRSEAKRAVYSGRRVDFGWYVDESSEQLDPRLARAQMKAWARVVESGLASKDQRYSNFSNWVVRAFSFALTILIVSLFVLLGAWILGLWTAAIVSGIIAGVALVSCGHLVGVAQNEVGSSE